jgi:hypothetical protein
MPLANHECGRSRRLRKSAVAAGSQRRTQDFLAELTPVSPLRAEIAAEVNSVRAQRGSGTVGRVETPASALEDAKKRKVPSASSGQARVGHENT